MAASAVSCVALDVCRCALTLGRARKRSHIASLMVWSGAIAPCKHIWWHLQGYCDHSHSCAVPARWKEIVGHVQFSRISCGMAHEKQHRCNAHACGLNASWQCPQQDGSIQHTRELCFPSGCLLWQLWG